MNRGKELKLLQSFLKLQRKIRRKKKIIEILSLKLKEIKKTGDFNEIKWEWPYNLKEIDCIARRGLTHPINTNYPYLPPLPT